MVETLLSNGFSVKGSIEHSGDLRIEGLVEGNIKNAAGTVIVFQTGRVQGDVHSEFIILDGRVEGNVYATKKVSIKKNGKILGAVHSPRIEVEHGAYLRSTLRVQDEEVKSKNAPVKTRKVKTVQDENDTK